MANIFSKLRSRFNEMLGEKELKQTDEVQKEYVEIDTDSSEGNRRLLVKNFTLTDFSDIKTILDDLREGYTICIVNIRPLRESDNVDLTRAISKLKKTIEAIEGDIAGLGEDYLIATPSIAKIYRGKRKPQVSEEVQKELEGEFETY